MKKRFTDYIKALRYLNKKGIDFIHNSFLKQETIILIANDLYEKEKQETKLTRTNLQLFEIIDIGYPNSLVRIRGRLEIVDQKRLKELININYKTIK